MIRYHLSPELGPMPCGAQSPETCPLETEPKSKWDWWTIGGRWGEGYSERQGETVGSLLSQIRQTRQDGHL